MPRHSLANVPAVVLAALLCACASRGPDRVAPPRADEAALRSFAARGYATQDSSGGTMLTRQTWWLGGREQVLHWMLPRAGSVAAPLVIYLPGLGESAGAGARWRQAWASAGYAVLSLQPLEADEAAFRSELARTGEFRDLARQRFAADEARRRLRVLAEVHDELQRRVGGGETPWRQIDLTRLALAGYDIGAWTAMVAAGERLPGSAAPMPALPLRAVIALSPHAVVADGGFETRWQDIRLPVLSITGDDDRDLLGLVPGALAREAPFVQMPAADKRLLSLPGLAHAAFGGGAIEGLLQAAAAETAGVAPSGDDARGQRGRGGGGGGGGSGGDGRGGAGSRGGERGPSGNEAGRPARGAANGSFSGTASSPTTLQMRLQAIQDVSTAFLDATLKDDALAREWLDRDAPRWLAGQGTLRGR